MRISWGRSEDFIANQVMKRQLRPGLFSSGFATIAVLVTYRQHQKDRPCQALGKGGAFDKLCSGISRHRRIEGSADDLSL